MTTTTTAGTLAARRAEADDQRAAEYSRRQAVFDVAGEDGRDPATALNAVERKLCDDYTTTIARLDAEIANLDKRIDARHFATLLIEAADTRYGA